MSQPDLLSFFIEKKNRILAEDIKARFTTFSTEEIDAELNRLIRAHKITFKLEPVYELIEVVEHA